MILQALKNYYHRMANDPDNRIAPKGWERKEIPFIIVLDREGNLVRIEDTREGEGKRKRARSFIVPQSLKKTVNVQANLLWDVAGYVFGVDIAGNPARAEKQKRAFRERLQEIGQVAEVQLVLGFLETVSMERLVAEVYWAEISEKNPILSFRITGEHRLICECEAVQKAISEREADKSSEGLCLVTGHRCNIARLHPSLKGVNGAQSSGANIISFNLDAFRSFNKDQGCNAPVGESAAFAYTTGLNNLLRRDSKQRMSVGTDTVICWSQKQTAFESDFSCFFSDPPKDDPHAGTVKLKALFDSVNTGAYCEDDSSCQFYVLGLAPNAARIAVRFWQIGTVGEFAKRIIQHFDDLNVVKPNNEPEFYSIWRLLVNIATQDKSENVPPNVAGDFMSTILAGTPYPATILQAALRRIHSDTAFRVKPVRAALIKAYLNRYYRVYLNKNCKEITVTLDRSQPSIGYQLGRLFAVLEKVQEEANPGLNATIRERFYGAACTTPVTVFATLLRLKNHHLAKMSSKGRVINFERQLSEIVGRVDDFPAHLDLHEQGRFAIGYYHQRQDFYKNSKT